MLPMGGVQLVPAESGISFLAIERYAARAGIRGAEFGAFRTIVTEIDAEWLAWVREQVPKGED